MLRLLPKIIVTKGNPNGFIIKKKSQEMKIVVDEACQPLISLISNKVTFEALSKSPKDFSPCLFHVLSKYENEHKKYHAYDDKRLSLPRLFILLLKPSFH